MRFLKWLVTLLGLTIGFGLAIGLLLTSARHASAAAHIITVTGTYLKDDGVTPSSGSVTFKLSGTARDSTSGKSYPGKSVTVVLDGSGHFTTNLVANDDPELAPTGTTYYITEIIDGRENDYNAVVPYASPGGTVDIAALAPSSPSLVYSSKLPTGMASTSTLWSMDAPTLDVDLLSHAVGMGDIPTNSGGPTPILFLTNHLSVPQSHIGKYGEIIYHEDTDPSLGKEAALFGLEQFNPSATASGVVYGVRGIVWPIGSSDMTAIDLRGIDGETQVNTTGTVNIGVARGVDAVVRTQTAGATVASAYGLAGYISSEIAGSTITNSYAVAALDGLSTGTITNKAGLVAVDVSGATNMTDLLVGSLSVPAGTFAIYSQSARPSVLLGGLTADSANNTFVVDATNHRVSMGATGAGLSNPSRLYIQGPFLGTPTTTSASSTLDVETELTNSSGNVYGGAFGTQFNPQATSSAAPRSFMGEMNVIGSQSMTGTVYGLNGQVDLKHSGTLTSAQGLFSVVLADGGTGTTTSAWGVRARVDSSQAGTTITNAFDYYAQNGASNSGTVTNRAGFVSDEITGGTNNTDVLIGTTTAPSGAWALSSASTRPSSFAGPVAVQAIISATPTIATTCTSSVAGAMVYVDKNNDAAVSHMCFCGTAADDVTYGWRRVDSPTTACP